MVLRQIGNQAFGGSILSSLRVIARNEAIQMNRDPNRYRSRPRHPLVSGASRHVIPTPACAGAWDLCLRLGYALFMPCLYLAYALFMPCLCLLCAFYLGRDFSAAISCQRGLVRWRASTAAVYRNNLLRILKPDITYRGVIGSSFQDFGPTAASRHREARSDPFMTDL
jgi:hypothetical protein